MKNLLKSALAPALAVAIAATALPASADQIINLRSGNVGVGGTDAAVSMLVGPLDTGFGSAFTGADFTSARTGPQAFIIPNHPAWVPPSSFSNPSAQWIGTNALASHPTAGIGNGASALFAIDFTITDTSITSATIDFDFSVDNILGFLAGFPTTGVNEGLFLNGTALSGSTSAGNFGSVFNLTRSDIAPLLVTGTNTLYINMTDVGGPAGLIFSATITTEGSTVVAVPEPGLIAIFALGLAGLGFGRWAHYRRI